MGDITRKNVFAIDKKKRFMFAVVMDTRVKAIDIVLTTDMVISGSSRILLMVHMGL